MSPLPEVQIGSEEPLYNIGVVARMTGISMASLRAWERRYDFPDSERTAGGHRLYSEKDVMRLHWVKSRIDEGMQTAQAIHALRHQEETGHFVFTEEYVVPHPSLQTEGAMKVFHRRLLDALIRRDIQNAENTFAEAVSVYIPDDLILDLIGPALTSVGDAWEKGEISVATEHLATNYLRQRLLMWMLSGPPPRSVGPIVLACAPDEWHEGSLLVLGALLRRRRWPVAYLGQAVPLEDLASFVGDLRPPLVVLVAMMEDSALKLAQWSHYLPKAAQEGNPVIGYGGRIFTLQPEWRIRMQGIYLGDTLKDGLNNIERLLPKFPG